jgi:hypothetical protein
MRPIGTIKLSLALAGFVFLHSVRVWTQEPAAQPSAPQAQPAQDGVEDVHQGDPESMLPHFHDTRFWLSGQANFIFRHILSFTPRTAGRTA